MDKKEFLIKTYEEINDNIKFSEAKNAALITLNSALIAASASKAFDGGIALNWRIMIILLMVCLLIPLIIALFSFKATVKHKTSDKDRFMYFSYIYKKYYKSNPNEDYYNHLKNVFDNSFAEEQLCGQIVDLSSVAERKFKLFNVAVIIEIIIFSLGFIIALALVLCKTTGVI